MKTLSNFDVSHLLDKVCTPTVVLHCLDDAAVPFNEGRFLGAGIRGARLVTLPGKNHLPLEGEPAFSMLVDEIHKFLGTGRRAESSSPWSDGTPPAPTLTPGERLEHHRVVALLGMGGMGAVYRAYDEQLEREVALKVLHSTVAYEPRAPASLLREARTASKLNHPNIATIYHVGKWKGRHYISMELVEGRPLSRAIPEEGLPTELVVHYSRQIADALAHAHSRGIIHRDLKSANIALTSDGRVKMLDFGLARHIPWMRTEQASRTGPSESRMIAGTLSYMAPETLRGEPADARSDIWALGAVIYEMATAALPFRGETAFEISDAIFHEPPAALPQALPVALVAVLLRCLQKAPTERYQTASEVLVALEALTSL